NRDKNRYRVNTSLNTGSVASRLMVERAEKHHSGNYTCAVGNSASATVAVHILNGCLPSTDHFEGRSVTKGYVFRLEELLAQLFVC
ncbi:hypothetical protein L9F63_024577, partial [Diploptera punctata]